MMKYLYFVCIMFVCVLQYSCVLQSAVVLESYRPKQQIIEELNISGQDKIKIISNQSYFYYDMYEWKELDSSDFDGYTIYVIEIWRGGQEKHMDFIIELVSVSVTECGVPLSFSIFQKAYPGDMRPEPISVPYTVKDGNSHKFFVKINKANRDIRELSIKYHIEINDIPVIKEHQYREEYAIRTKHHKLFRRWIHPCDSIAQ